MRDWTRTLLRGGQLHPPRDAPRDAPALLGAVHWFRHKHQDGLHERLLCALPTARQRCTACGQHNCASAPTVWCALVLSWTGLNRPTLEFWEHILDLPGAEFERLDPLRARGLSDMLPRFLERLQERVGHHGGLERLL